MARSRTKPRAAPARARVAHPEPREPYLGVQRGIVLGLLVAMAVVFWRPAIDHFGLPRATVALLAVLALTVVSGVRVLRSGRVTVPRSPAVWAAVAFVGALAVSFAASGDRMLAALGPYTRYTGVLMYGAYALLFVAVLRHFDRGSVRGIAHAMVGALGVVVAYGLLQLAGADPWDWEASAELYRQRGLDPQTDFSTIGNIDFSAAFVGITFPFGLWLALTAKSRAGRAVGAAAAVGAVVYVLGIDAFQGPITVLIGAAAVLAAWAVEHRDRAAGLLRRHRAAAAGGGLLACLAVAGGLVALSPSIEHELRSGLEERTQFWQAAGDMFTDEPVTGVGFGGFSDAFLRYRPVEHGAERDFQTADAPHNVFLGFLAEGGVLVALAFLGVVAVTGWALVRGLRRTEGDNRMLLAAFGGAWIAYLVQATVSIDVPPLAVLHWVVAAAIVVLGTSPDLREHQLFARAGRTAPPQLRGRRRAVSRPFGVPEAAVVAVGLVAAWFVIQPLRADLAAGNARDLRGVGDANGAVAELEQANSLAPWEGSYWAAAAAAYDRLGSLERALEAGIRAAEEDPGNSFYCLAVAQIAERMERRDVAATWYGEALRRDPHNPEVMHAIGAFELRRDDPERAIDMLEQATSLRPTMQVAWELLASAYDAVGDDDSASQARQAMARMESN